MDTLITVRKSHSDDLVNATEMAKPFEKYVQDWTRQKSTNEFISVLSEARGIPVAGLLKIQNGIGTWMHEDVALLFARISARRPFFVENERGRKIEPAPILPNIPYLRVC
jgi:hypothetical protein